MKILIAAFFSHMPPFPGAASLRGASVAEGFSLLAKEFNVDVVFYTAVEDAQSIGGVEVVSLKASAVENTRSLMRRLLGEIRMGYLAASKSCCAKFKPDLLVISSPPYIATLIQIFFAKIRGITYVLDVRDIYPQVYADAGLLKRQSVFYRIFQVLSRWSYRHAKLVICATRGLAREVRQEASGAHVECVYNGFPESLSLRKADKYKRFTVCFHGVLGFFQDIETLVKIASLLYYREIDILVVGYGRKEDLLRSVNLPNLKFLGRQPFERTISEIERCHLGLCLRLDDEISRDAFPVKLWEYLGLGIPSIVTPPGEAGEFVIEHQCGMVHNSGDVEAIISTILTLRDDPDLLKKLSDNCRKIAVNYTRKETGLAAARMIAKIAKDVRMQNGRR